ncbi:MAG TPA: FAD-binding protein [Bryobacteraceae bacterium]|nr:FAD-binding protein [Bryobacteraceae bacterium]
MPTVETQTSESVIQITTKTPPTHLEDRLQTGTTGTARLHVAAIEHELRMSIAGEVRFGDGDRGMYASDAGNYRMIPIGVVLPKSAEDVAHTVRVARRYGAPVFARGGGTGIPGQTVNVAVLLDFSKYMNRIEEINAEERYAWVEPGIILDELRHAGQSFLLSDFLKKEVKGYTPPQLHRKAVIHGHCHHKSLLHFESEVELLKKAGLDCEALDSGCCGMAGSFGYEEDHYETGLACGERVLLPKVRGAAANELIVADGFSCREMIRQGTDRRAMHLAQVPQMAMQEGPNGPAGAMPEARYTKLERTSAAPVGLVAGGLVAAAGIWWGMRGR